VTLILYFVIPKIQSSMVCKKQNGTFVQGC